MAKIVVNDSTVQEVYEAMSPEKKDALHIVIGKALEAREIPGVRKVLSTFTDHERRITVFMLGTVSNELFGDR
jgi:hypothetical protein